MYARVVKSETRTERHDELVRKFKEVVADGESQHGFLGAFLLTDPLTGMGMSVTLWDSEADVIATEESGWWQKQVDHFNEEFTAAPVREHYEVSYARYPANPMTEGPTLTPEQPADDAR